MQVESLKDYLVENKEELIRSILRGKYRPNPVRRVDIPKDNGESGSWAFPRSWIGLFSKPLPNYSYHCMNPSSAIIAMGSDRSAMPTGQSPSAPSTLQQDTVTQLI